MVRLRPEEANARASTKVVSATEAVAWLRDLRALWAGADDSGRRLLTEAIFEKVGVLGVQSVSIHPTPEADAHGWSEAFGSVPLLLDAGRALSTDGRGERVGNDDIDWTCSGPGGTRCQRSSGINVASTQSSAAAGS